MIIGTVEIPSQVVLAPMAGVTDRPFREICRSFYKGLMVTEMISVSALYFKDQKTHTLAAIPDGDRPTALQIFTADPERLEAVMDVINGFNHDILDINMGCPAPKIVNNGEGSALMRTPALARRIVKVAVQHSRCPVTVKMRTGWDAGSINAVAFAEGLADAGAAAIAVHGRTREQQYSGLADWRRIAEVKRAVTIPVIGNGDVFSVEDAIHLKAETGCDGIMIGRGVQGNPWLLEATERYLESGEMLPKPSPEQMRHTVCAHFEKLVAYKGAHIAVLEMRKHAAWYMKGMHGASLYKNAINRARSVEAVREILDTAFLV